MSISNPSGSSLKPRGSTWSLVVAGRSLTSARSSRSRYVPHASNCLHLHPRGEGDLPVFPPQRVLTIAPFVSFSTWVLLHLATAHMQGGFTVPAYAAAKGALGQLTKALSNEWSKENVQVNGICPGYIATDM